METRLGLIPATISPYVIARMGEGSARRVFMSARVFSAAEAVALNFTMPLFVIIDFFDFSDSLRHILNVRSKALNDLKH